MASSDRPGRGEGVPSGCTWPLSSLLCRLPPVERERLLALGTEVRYPAGRVLVRSRTRRTSCWCCWPGWSR